MKTKILFVALISVMLALPLGFGKVNAQQCADSMIASNREGYTGDTGIIVPIYGKVCGLDIGGDLEDLDGVSFAMQYDTSLVVCDTILYDVSDPVYPSFHDSIPNPFFWAPYIDPSGYVTVGLAFAMLGTPDIPPGRYRMFDLVFKVKPGAPPGVTPLDIEDGVGGMRNAFTYVTTDVYPELIDGDFIVLPDSLTLIFDPLPPYRLGEGENLGVEVTAIDPNPTHFVTLSAAGLMENMSFPETSDFFFATGTFTFYPNQCQAGVYNVVFFADCDFGCHVEIPVTMTVDNINRTPRLDAGPDRAIIAGDTLTFTVTATDPDYWECGDDTLTLNATSLPGAATFVQDSDTTGIFSWVPDLADTGEYTVIFSVEDLAGTTDSEPVEITVSPHTLVIMTIPDSPPTTVNEGSALIFDVRAINSSSEHTVDLYAIYLPANANFPSETGAGSVQSTFTFNPNYCQAGSDSVVFEAHCSGNLTTTRTVYLTVNDIPKAPNIEAGGPYSAKPNHLLTFRVMAADPDLKCGDEALILSALNLPGGVTFSQDSDTTGVFNWIPVEADTGSYTVTFIVDDHTALADSDQATIKVVVYDFEDVTDDAFVGDEGRGHGVAWGDWDGDGDLDIYIVNYNEPNVLYRNNGDGTFTNVAAAAGVAHAGAGHGSAWGDFDNDGDLDLYVTNDGPNILYRNNGDGTFTDVTSTAGVGNIDWGRGTAWGDFDNDGNLDLYVVNSLSTQTSVLYRNNGDGIFTDVTSTAGVEFMGNGRGVAWGDCDSDGDLDLYVVNHWPGGSALYRNNGDGTFTNVASSAGVGNNGLGTGVAWGDYDSDGHLDLSVVNYGGYGNFLYRNNGDGTFNDVTGTAGVGLVDNGYGTAWADYDLDADLDLYVVNYQGGRKAYGINILYSNNGDETFSDATERAGVGDPGYGYGTAWGDYDDDGDLDLYVVNHDQANILYQNQTDNVDFIKVVVEGAAYLGPGFSNRDGMGAKVEVHQAGTETLLGFREVRGGSGYCSMNSLEAEFGLDHNYAYDLKVTFPASGVVRVYSNLTTGQKILVYEERAPFAFSLISPADGDTAWSLTPTMTWQRAVDPDPGDIVTYTVYYSEDNTFATYDSLPDVGDTTCSLPELTDDTVYYWKAKGRDNWGLEAWSVETFSFNVYFPEAPNAFDLLYPTDGDTIYAGMVTLDWEEATEPDPGDSVLYTLHYSISPEFHPDSTNIVDSLSESQYLIVSGLPDDAKIYWKVKAFDIFGLETWSKQIDWSFYVYTPEAPHTFSLISPADRDTVWSFTPTLIWQRAVDPDPGDSVTYTLYYSTDSAFVVQDSVSPLADTTCTLPILTDDSTYYWKVKGTDNFGLEAWSVEIFSFNVYLVEPPDSFDLFTPIDGDTVYAGIPIRLDWEDASDPDPGDIILYALYLSLNSDFSDSMAIDSLSESECTLDQTKASTKTLQVRNPGRQALPEMKLEMQEVESNNASEFIESSWSIPKSNLDSLLADTTYYWKVKAYDRWGTEKWSNQLNWNFYVQFSSLFIRGDYDANGELAMADALGLLVWKYHQPGGVPPPCEDAADYDDNGDISMADAVGLLLFKYHQPGGVPPPPPYPDCGPDPTKDGLSCDSYPPCNWPPKATELVVSSLLVSVEVAPNVVKVGDGYLAKDGLVVVPVELTNKAELRGFEFTVNYDPALVTAIEVRGGDGYDFFAPWIDNEAGKVTVGCVPDMSMEEPFAAGQRGVAEIAFKAKADAGLKLSDVALYGSKAEAVDARWVNGVVKAGAGLPKEFALKQNYPNPFNAITEIKYTLPKGCYVGLEVYNVLGQKVACLVDRKQKAGYKTARWDAGSLSSGVYFYRLQAGDFVQMRKMVLLK